MHITISPWALLAALVAVFFAVLFALGLVTFAAVVVADLTAWLVTRAFGAPAA